MVFRLSIISLVALLSSFISPLYVHAQSIESASIKGEQIEVLIDPTHQLTVFDILNEEVFDQNNLQWEKSISRTPSYGFSPHTYWFRFALPAQAHERLLELDYALLDNISFYRLKKGKIVETILTGDQYNFSERPIKHRAFLFPLPKTDQEQTILLKIRSTSAVQFSLTVWPNNTFFEREQNFLIEHGLYYGVVLVMSLYNLFLFFRVKDNVYVYYVIYVSIFAINQLTLSGFAFQFLWPNVPTWNEKSLAVLSPIALVCALLFVNAFLKVKINYPKIYKFTSLLIIVSLIATAASIVYPYSMMIPYVASLAIVISSTILTVSYYVMFNRRYKYDVYFSAAWSALLIGVAILSMNKLGILPRNTFTESAAQIGSGIEVILLSFALAERFYDAMNRRLVAEKESLLIKEELIFTQKKQNQELESRVNSRTK